VEELEAIQKALQSDHNKYEAESITDSLQQARAWIGHAEGNDQHAVEMLRTLAEKEDASGASGNHEMLGDLLLEMNRPDQALTEYEADLKTAPNRFNGLYGAARAAEMADKSEKANSYYAQLVKVCDGSNSDRPELSRAKALLAQK
jgi:tetratricopeptide (TPR) repeat protein